jgi:hypothetical protein
MHRWLREQFRVQASDLPDQPPLNTAGKTNTDFTPLQRAFFENAVNGGDQLRQRVAFALSEIWVVSAVTVRPALPTRRITACLSKTHSAITGT